MYIIVGKEKHSCEVLVLPRKMHIYTYKKVSNRAAHTVQYIQGGGKLKICLQNECNSVSYDGLFVSVEAAMISFLRASSISCTIDSVSSLYSM